MPSLRIIFLGAPGAGKGTQARRIGDRFGLEPLSSGDVMRAEIADGSEVGKQAAQYVESGTLVPDEVITNVILASIEKLGSDAGVILDGFPRTVPQAKRSNPVWSAAPGGSTR